MRHLRKPPREVEHAGLPLGERSTLGIRQQRRHLFALIRFFPLRDGATHDAIVAVFDVQFRGNLQPRGSRTCGDGQLERKRLGACRDKVVVVDTATGRMLNADMEFYRLATLKDVGKLKVHMMTGEKYDSRGIIGLGEPPVISPGAAIANAVANACGVRVPELPLTPDRVLDSLEKGGMI